MNTKTVLVVDDSKVQLIYAKGLLERAGYSVITSEHIWILGIVLKQKPDMILMDVEVDGFVGTDSVKSLKNTRARDLPIYLYSGKTESELRLLARECGANGFIRKETSGIKCRLIETVNGVLNSTEAQLGA